MRRFLIISLSSVILCLVLSFTGFAETIEGEVVCLGCSLKKEQSASAQCSIYGHTHALKTEDGEVLTFLENDESTDLINNHDYKGKKVKIKGRRFQGSNVVEVDSVKVKSKRSPKKAREASSY